MFRLLNVIPSHFLGVTPKHTEKGQIRQETKGNS